MPLPNFYHDMPYQGDNHFGKEVFTKRYFWLKQKAIYPILACVAAGCTIGVLSSIKHMSGNNNVTLAHSKLGAWNSTQLNSIDVAKFARPAPETVLPPTEE